MQDYNLYIITHPSTSYPLARTGYATAIRKLCKKWLLAEQESPKDPWGSIMFQLKVR